MKDTSKTAAPAAEDVDPVDAELARLRARRELARTREEDKAKAQRVKDLAAIADLEDSLGSSNVAVLEVPYTEGLPVLVAVRTPKKIEIKKYRSDLRSDDADVTKAAEALGHLIRVYPDAETFEKVLDARPGVQVQMGTAGVALATARAEKDAKR